MLRIHMTAALAAALIGSIFIGGSPSVGEEPPRVDDPPALEPPLDEKPAKASLSPSDGPVDAEVTISGDSCLAGEKPGSLNFGFTRNDYSIDVNLSPLDGYFADLNGDWSFTTTVPLNVRNSDGTLQPVEPGPGYVFHAVCVFQDQPELWIFYPPLAFEVTGPRTLNPPSPGTPDPGPGNPQSSSNPAAVSPATPIEDDPPFTG